MNFGIILKNLRAEYQMTQQDLAKRINKNRSTIAGYESENKQPDFETLEKIADVFNVSIDYLLGKTSDRNSLQKQQIKSLENYINEAESLMLYGKVMNEKDKESLLTAIKIAYETAIKKNKEKQ